MIKEIVQIINRGYTVKIADDDGIFAVTVCDRDEDVIAETFDESLIDAIDQALAHTLAHNQ